MYIGPWQEYRLAKIQDDAIQRIRNEWEENLRSQLPDGDDARIRELMQPLMAKLPSLLLAKKGSADISESGGKTRRPRPPRSATSDTRPSTAASTTSSTRSRVSRDEAAPSKARTPDNQETHEDDDPGAKVHKSVGRQTSAKKIKKKAQNGPTMSALEAVEKRKKMFAKWMKAKQPEESGSVAHAANSEAQQTSIDATRLPPIHSDAPLPTSAARAAAEPTRLPPLVYAEDERTSDEPETPAVREEPNLEDSLDEDEVNQLLNWTDNLLSPNALDASLAGLDDDLGDLG